MSWRMLGFGLALGLAVVMAPAPAIGQERNPAPEVSFRYVQASGARLGVFLEPGCEIELHVRGDCEESPRVRAVVHGSPADVAGFLAGDTLLMLDGVSLRSEPGRRSLSRLRAGIPIEITVGRESGRSTLRAIPDAREGSVWVRSYGGNVMAVGPAPRAEFNVFQFRDDSGEIAEFQFGPELDGPPSPDGFVVFSPDEAGSLQVRIMGDHGITTMTVEGVSVSLEELEGHMVELSESMQHEGARALEVVVGIEGREDMRRHLILENPELARRLASIRVESLAAAREQLKLLVERRSELERRGEIPAAYAYSFRVETPVAPGTERSRTRVVTRGLPEMSHRLGGAEFRELTPELAEYFDVESGLLVLRVISGTPCASLGLRGGDVVIEVGGHDSPDMATFQRLASSAGDAGLEVKWIRKGTIHTGQLPGR